MTGETIAQALGFNVGRGLMWAPFLTDAMERFEINTPLRQAAFLAQIGHESDGLSVLEENLNYSSGGLLAVFSKYFTPVEAIDYQHQPERIANRVYANRMGNGDEASGDGYKYRGHGLMQLTGKDDHKECGDALGKDFLNYPEALLLPDNASMAAAWEWNRGKLNALADSGQFEKITRIINGGLNGEDHRLALYKSAKLALGVA